MGKELKEAGGLFAIRVLSDALISLNISAVASGDWHRSIVTSATLSGFNFFIIKRIASARGDAAHLWIAYVSGSVVGSLAGVWLAHHV